LRGSEAVTPESEAVWHGLGSCSVGRVEAAKTLWASEGERYLKASTLNSDRYLSMGRNGLFRAGRHHRGGRHGMVFG
jgi:hypothetical protein